MKQTMKRIFTLTLTVLMVAAMSTSALATEASSRASAYLTYYGVSLNAVGSVLHIEYDVAATKTVDEVGVYQIAIHQQDDDGDWVIIDSLYAVDYPEFVDYDSMFHAGELDYQAEANNTYRVAIAFFAGGEDGSDARTITSVVAYT